MYTKVNATLTRPQFRRLVICFKKRFKCNLLMSREMFGNDSKNYPFILSLTSDQLDLLCLRDIFTIKLSKKQVREWFSYNHHLGMYAKELCRSNPVL